MDPFRDWTGTDEHGRERGRDHERKGAGHAQNSCNEEQGQDQRAFRLALVWASGHADVSACALRSDRATLSRAALSSIRVDQRPVSSSRHVPDTAAQLTRLPTIGDDRLRRDGVYGLVCPLQPNDPRNKRALVIECTLDRTLDIRYRE